MLTFRSYCIYALFSAFDLSSERYFSFQDHYSMDPPPIPSSPPPIPPFPPPPIPQFYAEATILSDSLVHNDISAALLAEAPALSLNEASTLPIARQLEQSAFYSNLFPDFNDSPSYDNGDDSHLIKDSASLDVTDKDFFLRLGYSETNIRKALIITSGDRNAALYILSRSMAGLEDLQSDKAEYSKWRKEADDDWISGVSKFGQPKQAENRAIQKSPIYISVGSSYRIFNGKVEFNVNVSMKDGRSWTVMRRYAEFASVWKSLPMGTCTYFSNSFPIFSSSAFPMAHAVMSMMAKDSHSSESIERQRHALSEWLRELVLNERCMQSAAVLSVLYRFVDVNVHGGPAGVETTMHQEQERLDAAFQRCLSDPSATSPLSFDDRTANKFTALPMLTESSALFRTVRLLGVEAFPVGTQQLNLMLPLKLDAAAVKQRLNAAVPELHGLDIDMKQLAKDMSRDRIIIQGIRILGAHSTIDYIIDVCKKSILQVIVSSGQMTVSGGGKGKGMGSPVSLSAAGHLLHIDASSLDVFCRCGLQAISRTESAYLSHASLHQVILDTMNLNQSSSWNPIIVVPESKLADALLLRFSVKVRGDSNKSAATMESPPSRAAVKGPLVNSAEWCVLCEGEASTVYRVMEPESMTLLSQVRVTYLTTIFAMPSRPATSAGMTTFSVKFGRSYIIVSKETTTTERDWEKT